MAMITIICLSFIVLNNFFANMCAKKIVPHQPTASPRVTGFSLSLFFHQSLYNLIFFQHIRLEPPHWLVKYAKSYVFGAFEADFLSKIENSPPHRNTAPPSNVWNSDFGRKISLNFGEDLFFLETTRFWAEKTLEFPITAEKSVSISVKTFFFFFLETTWFWAEKTLEFPISAEKSVSISLKTFFFLSFFLETTWFWVEKTFEFPSFPRNSILISGQTVRNWFKNNENSCQGRLHFSHSFKIALPFPNPGYAPGIIPQLFVQKKIIFNTVKNCKKVEIVSVTTSNYNY